MTPADEPLGSAAHEAARLLDTLKEWLDGKGMGEVPLATGSAECKLCPFCLALSALRDHNPEVVEQLGKAGEALLAALRSALSEHEKGWAAGRAPDVERITIDE
jgi:hypothetical protein